MLNSLAGRILFPLKKAFSHAILSFLKMAGSLMVVISISYSNSIDNLPWLPANEDEAQRMIKDGTLDSQTWDQIKFYYIQPISVPYGELCILSQIFHGQFDNLPVISDQLNKYEPWDIEKVNQFFRDYPSIVKYAPILEFPQRKAIRIGRAGFYLAQSGISQNNYGTRFSLGESMIKFEGSVGISEQLARWSNRKISIIPTKWSALQFGNFYNSGESELVYGYFPVNSKIDSSVYDNWRYGNAGNWNGICLEFKNINVIKRIGSKLCLYYHERPEEKSYGLQSEIKTGTLKVKAGISGLFISSVPDSFYYIHCSAEYSFSGISLHLQSDFNFQSENLPVLFSVDCKKLGNSFNADLYYFPSRFYAPRSAILNRIDENVEDTAGDGGPIFFFRFHSSHSITGGISWLPEISIKLKNGMPVKIKSSANISGFWSKINYNFRYDWAPLSNENMSNEDHQICLKFSSGIGILNLCMNNSLKLNKEKQSYYGLISSELKCSQALEITPFISITKNKSEDYCLGLKEKLLIFEKNSVEFTIKQLLPVYDWEGFHVQCNAWFLF